MYDLSGLNNMAFALAVYASQLSSPRRDCTATQNSLPAGGQPLPDGIGYPQDYSVKFQSLHLHDLLLTQASPGATKAITLPTHAAITAEIRPGSPSRYPAAQRKQTWNHQGLGNRLIEPPVANTNSGNGVVRRRERLGGILNYYYRQAA